MDGFSDDSGENYASSERSTPEPEDSKSLQLVQLPADEILQIIRRLDFKSATSLYFTCKRFRNIIMEYYRPIRTQINYEQFSEVYLREISPYTNLWKKYLWMFGKKIKRITICGKDFHNPDFIDSFVAYLVARTRQMQHVQFKNVCLRDNEQKTVIFEMIRVKYATAGIEFVSDHFARCTMKY